MRESTFEKRDAETGGEITDSDETIAVSRETPERHRCKEARATGADPLQHMFEAVHRSTTARGPTSAFKPDPFW
ncbi:MAG: hypothetical protein OJF47_000274 [Nitrospira sp.]|jgi:hypothetical protein|nr:MAG: hypothetical protein OJF47_000274 [Nitrospira sp.]